MLNCDILDRVHARQELRRSRSFTYFQAHNQIEADLQLPGRE